MRRNLVAGSRYRGAMDTAWTPYRLAAGVMAGAAAIASAVAMVVVHLEFGDLRDFDAAFTMRVVLAATASGAIWGGLLIGRTLADQAHVAVTVMIAALVVVLSYPFAVAVMFLDQMILHWEVPSSYGEGVVYGSAIAFAATWFVAIPVGVGAALWARTLSQRRLDQTARSS